MEAGGKLKMQTSFTGSSGPTAYSKAASLLNVTGRLTVSADEGRQRELAITSSMMSAESVEQLQIPLPAPGELLDARTEYGTLYLSPGITGIDIRGNGEVTIAFQPILPVQGGYELIDKDGVVLAAFTGSQPVDIQMTVNGSTRVFLKIVSASAGNFALEQNYPNPFSPSSDGATTVSFSLSRPSQTRLAVYDMMGREVRILIDQDLPAGVKHVRWDGKDESGAFAAPGSYLLRLQSAEGTVTRSMLLTSSR